MYAWVKTEAERNVCCQGKSKGEKKWGGGNASAAQRTEDRDSGTLQSLCHIK